MFEEIYGSAKLNKKDGGGGGGVSCKKGRNNRNAPVRPYSFSFCLNPVVQRERRPVPCGKTPVLPAIWSYKASRTEKYAQVAELVVSNTTGSGTLHVYFKQWVEQELSRGSTQFAVCP